MEEAARLEQELVAPVLVLERAPRREQAARLEQERVARPEQVPRQAGVAQVPHRAGPRLQE